MKPMCVARKPARGPERRWLRLSGCSRPRFARHAGRRPGERTGCPAGGGQELAGGGGLAADIDSAGPGTGRSAAPTKRAGNSARLRRIGFWSRNSTRSSRKRPGVSKTRGSIRSATTGTTGCGNCPFPRWICWRPPRGRRAPARRRCRPTKWNRCGGDFEMTCCVSRAVCAGYPMTKDGARTCSSRR